MFILKANLFLSHSKSDFPKPGCFKDDIMDTIYVILGAAGLGKSTLWSS